MAEACKNCGHRWEDHYQGNDLAYREQHGQCFAAECECDSFELLEGFTAWWAAKVQELAPTIQHKAEEYGSNSLAQLGHLFARAQGRTVPEAEALEIGCFLYAYGKMQRVGDALLAGKLPSSDSWLDAGIYSFMSAYIRECGAWP